AEQIHPVGLSDVPVERRGVELGQNEDSADVGVQAVADRNVDQAIFAGDRHGGLRTQLREREEARTLPAAEHESEDFVIERHRAGKWYTVAMRRCNVYVN